MKLKNEGKTINGVDINEKLQDNMNKTEIPKDIDNKLKTVTQTPKDKWALPQTSNQEIGWFVDVTHIMKLESKSRWKIHL